MTDPASSLQARRVAGRAFEDILDGYFPLEESIRQMMARQRFGTVWITLLHAPIMNIKGLAPTDPVPFSLRKTYAGMIDRMTLVVRQDTDKLQIDGLGDWFWLDPRDNAPSFAPSIRLGEPAFIRGVGVSLEQAVETTSAVALADCLNRDQAGRALNDLGWTSARIWGGYSTGSGIQLAGAGGTETVCTGEELRTLASVDGEAGSPANGCTYVLLNTSPDQVDAEALELARRL